MSTVSNSLQLWKSVFDVPSTSNEGALVSTAKAVSDWVIRERIDGKLFELFKQNAAGLAYPNEKGLELHKAIEDSDAAIRLDKRSPLKLVVSGSLGRSLSGDSDLRYLVTTLAALSTSHDPAYAADVVCAMMFDQGGHEEELQPQYTAMRTPMRAILAQVMESVYKHVVNPGLRLAELPAQLSGLHGHCLDPETLAAVIMGIRTNKGDIFGRSQYFLSDLVSWLLHHFEGDVKVSVDGHVVYPARVVGEKDASPVRRRFHFHCQGCPENRKDCKNRDGELAVGTVSREGFKAFVSHRSDCSYQPQNFTRAPLYDIPRILGGSLGAPSSKLAGLNAHELIEIKARAQDVARWLLARPVHPAAGQSITFKVSFEHRPRASEKMSRATVCIGTLLQTHPSLGNLKTGMRGSDQTAFVPPDVPDDVSMSEYTDYLSYESHLPENVLPCFPHANSLIEEDIKPRCSCSACSDDLRLDNCKPGCLRHTSISILFALIGHSVADGLGADSVSGNTSLREVVQMTSRILSDVINFETVEWETWFRFTACVVLGITPDVFPDHPTGAVVDGLGTVSAAQNGSLVVAADWLDVQGQHGLEGCFSVSVRNGAISGVQDDLAIIQCERPGAPQRTQDSRAAQQEPHTGAADFLPALEYDAFAVDSFVVTFASGSKFYGLLTVVEAGDLVRIIDPSLAMKSIILSVSCNGESQEQAETGNVADHSSMDADLEHHIHDFRRILCDWVPNSNPRHICITKGTSSNLKFNIAMALACHHNIVVVNGNQRGAQGALGLVVRRSEPATVIVRVRPLQIDAVTRTRELDVGLQH